ncbi:hypothetical protein [Niabella hirudinis]|uniref:hypothetical protein n=1 Tax=Niabella hirudinis TaxID=1285929 RepID=UPI003EB93317
MLKKIVLAALVSLPFLATYAQDIETPSPRLRISASGGYAYRLGKKPSSNDYYKNISRGPAFEAGFSYFFNRQSGIGIKYSEFSSSGSGNLVTGQFASSNIKIRYAGPVYQTRLISYSGNFHFLSGISLGYLGYRDNAVIGPAGANSKGSTIGAMAELGGDLRIVRKLFAGILISVYSGKLSSMQVNGASVKLNEQQLESLSRIEGSVGLRYSFF